MSTIDYLILALGVGFLLAAASTIILCCVDAANAAERRNTRAQRLGNLLLLSHPEWK